MAGRRAASRCPFERMPVTGARGRPGAIAIANVRLLDLDGDKRLDIVASEMRTGPVLRRPGQGSLRAEADRRA